MFESIIEDQNPHWRGEFYNAEINRSCFQLLLDYLGSDNIVTLTGVRRSGKSTLLELLIDHLIRSEQVNPKNILYLRLEETRLIPYADDPMNLERILEEFKTLQNPQGQIYCLLDEIQFFRDWPIFVKSHFESKKVKFVITGSNSQMLSSDMMTLLSGRTLPLDVFPLSFRECANWRQIPIRDPQDIIVHRHPLQKEMKDYLKWGGFPAVLREPKEHVRSQMLNSYAKTVINLDVVPRLKIKKSRELEILYTYLISNFSHRFSYHKLGQQLHLSDKSVKEYIKALCDAFLLFEVEMFSYSVKQQIRNPKKIYGIDVGQINAISFKFSKNHGKLLENQVFIDLKRLGLDIYYYKTSEEYEVDFCARMDAAFALIQVVWEFSESDTKERELKALWSGMEEKKLETGLILTKDHEEVFQDGTKTIITMPAYKFFCLTREKRLNLLFGHP